MKINYTNEDLLDHHAVSAVIKNSKGEILIQEHVKFGFFTIPIGKAKPGQTPIEGIKEEIMEECNLKIKDLKEIFSKKMTYLREGKNVNVIVHVYEIFNYSGKLKNKEPEKHKEQKFMPLEEIKNIPYLSDCTIFFLETIGIKREAKI